MAVERVASDCHSLDHHVRIALHQDAILERPRLALVCVAQEVCWFDCVARDETPLHSGRESGASPAAQSTRLHLFDDSVLVHRQRLFESLIPAALAILIDARLTWFVYVCKKYLSHCAA